MKTLIFLAIIISFLAASAESVNGQVYLGVLTSTYLDSASGLYIPLYYEAHVTNENFVKVVCGLYNELGVDLIIFSTVFYCKNVNQSGLCPGQNYTRNDYPFSQATTLYSTTVNYTSTSIYGYDLVKPSMKTCNGAFDCGYGVCNEVCYKLVNSVAIIPRIKSDVDCL